MNSENYKQLYHQLGYTFQDEDLLNQALTHCSMGEPNNERLEFLGDSILDFIVANILFDKYPDAREGNLTQQRALLVCGEVLVEIAYELQLMEFLRVGPGEDKARRRQSMFEDVVEALVAAIYLDSDLDTCKRVVRGWFTSRFDIVAELPSLKDPKSNLQEWAQAQHLPLPKYSVTSSGPEHQPVFVASCSIAGIEYRGEGTGPNRRKAEQAAAMALLEQVKINHE